MISDIEATNLGAIPPLLPPPPPPYETEITWDTNEPADSLVRYSLNSDLSPFWSVEDPNDVCRHTITLPGPNPPLINGEVYYYKVFSEDTEDNLSEYPQVKSFKAGAPPTPIVPPFIVVASAGVGYNPVIAWAYDITDTNFKIRLIDDAGGDPGLSSVQWIAVSQGMWRLNPDERLAIQTEHTEHNNAEWVYYPILFDSTAVSVVNNAHSSPYSPPVEPYIASPRDAGPLRFMSAFIEHDGGSPPRAWLQWIAVGEGDPTLVPDLAIQADIGTYSDGEFVFFPTSFTGTPVVVANAYDPATLKPVIASAWGNGTGGFFISLTDDIGASVSGANVQWIAVGLRP